MRSYKALIALFLALAAGCYQPSFIEELKQVRKEEKSSRFQLKDRLKGMKSFAKERDAVYDAHFRDKPVIYRFWEDIDFEEVPEEKVPVPEDYQKRLRDMRDVKMEDKTSFEELVFKEAEKLGYNKKRISTLQPKEVITFCLDVVASKFTWTDVDRDENFLKEHGEHQPIDKYFRLGKGDCDKYASAMMAIFDIAKRMNPNLANIYVAPGNLGGKPLVPHAWTSIILQKKDKTLVTHIDPTFYDTRNDLKVDADFHLPETPEEFLAIFYLKCKAYELGFEWYDRLYKKTADVKKKAQILYKMAVSASMLMDPEKMDSALERYIMLRESGKLEDDTLDPNMAYWSHSTNRQSKIAEKYKNLILRRFPESHTAEFIRDPFY